MDTLWAFFKDTLFQLFGLMLLASLVPFVVLLIFAAFNERVRRVVLALTVGLVLLVGFLTLAVMTHDLSRVSGWDGLRRILVDTAVSYSPAVIALIALGVVGWLSIPRLIPLLAGNLHLKMRQDYLAQVIARFEPRSDAYVPMRQHGDLFERPAQNTILLGGTGQGKTFLLSRMAARLAREALAHPRAPIPIWVDLDALLAGGFSFDAVPAAIEPLQPFRAQMLDKMLRREVVRKRACFLVDTSLQTFDLAESEDVFHAVSQLMRFFAPCPVIVAMPDAFQAPQFTGRFGQVNRLARLQEYEAQLMLETLAPKAAAVKQPLQAQPWRSLSGSPWLVARLAAYLNENATPPENLRELFRRVVYPAGFPPGEVEAGLARVAADMSAANRSWISADRVVEIFGRVTGRLQVKDFIRAGLLVTLARDNAAGGRPADPDSSGKSIVGFAHPLLRAYFNALAWFGQEGFALDAEEMLDDPLLADTLVYLNNLEGDPGRFLGLLVSLAGRKESAAHVLAARCLMAMPDSSRDPAVTREVSARLVERMGSDAHSAASAWSLLQTLPAAERVALYQESLTAVDKLRRQPALARIAELSCTPDAPAGELPGILLNASDELIVPAVKAWSGVSPDSTLAAVCDLYERGPEDRQVLAIQMLGLVPHDGAVKYLRHCLVEEHEPRARIEVLRSLVDQGDSNLFDILLDVLSDPHEAPEVRSFAAQLIAYSELPDPKTGAEQFRRLVRINRGPLPEEARAFMETVFSSLRRRYPAQISAWEGLINPYTTSRPVASIDMLFGRAALLHSLHTAVENGSHVLLYGEKRIGKTSVLQQIARDMKESARQGLPRRVVIAELQGLKPKEFYYRLMEAILAGLDDPALPAQPGSALPYTDRAFERDMNAILEHLSRKGEAARFALLLDDADDFLDFPAENQAAFKRMMARLQPPIFVFIFAASRPFGSDSPLCDAVTGIQVQRLTTAETADLITRPVENALQYDRDALDLILKSSQGRPYAVQAVCQQVVNAAQSKGITRVTAALAREFLPGDSATGSPRAELIEESGQMIGAFLDWVESHPELTPAQMDDLAHRIALRLEAGLSRRAAEIRAQAAHG